MHLLIPPKVYGGYAHACEWHLRDAEVQFSVKNNFNFNLLKISEELWFGTFWQI